MAEEIEDATFKTYLPPIPSGARHLLPQDDLTVFDLVKFKLPPVVYLLTSSNIPAVPASDNSLFRIYVTLKNRFGIP